VEDPPAITRTGTASAIELAEALQNFDGRMSFAVDFYGLKTGRRDTAGKLAQ